MEKCVRKNIRKPGPSSLTVCKVRPLAYALSSTLPFLTCTCRVKVKNKSVYNDTGEKQNEGA